MDLITARKNAGMPRDRAAVAIGVALSTLGRWEKGISNVPAYVIPKIREVYGLSDSDVLSLFNDMKEAANG